MCSGSQLWIRGVRQRGGGGEGSGQQAHHAGGKPQVGNRERDKE